MSETMITTLIVAVVSAVASITVQMIASLFRKRETDVTLAVHEQKQEDTMKAVREELSEVKKKLDIHNHYAEKIGSIEKNITALQKDIEYLRKR